MASRKFSSFKRAAVYAAYYAAYLANNEQRDNAGSGMRADDLYFQAKEKEKEKEAQDTSLTKLEEKDEPGLVDLARPPELRRCKHAFAG
jgi:hypothetical protein